MELSIDPHSLEVGKKNLEKLKEENFQGYLPRYIEDLLKITDKKLCTFEQLGTTEIEVLDLMIMHIGKEQLTLRYPFPYGFLKGTLECRKKKALAAKLTSIHVNATPTRAPNTSIQVTGAHAA